MKNSTHSYPTVVLTGLESAGKSALFRGLSGEVTGDETNFRGSTVLCRKCHLQECECNLVDTPGIRLKGDSQTTQLALQEIHTADVVVLVVRGTHFQLELKTLLEQVELEGKRKVLAITFEDKAAPELLQTVEQFQKKNLVPVVLVNARDLGKEKREALLEAIRHAAPSSFPAFFSSNEIKVPPIVQPSTTCFERPILGPLLSMISMVLLFAIPVYAAFIFADTLQPLIDEKWINPLKLFLEKLPSFLFEILGGSYGVITLGWYSFLWAFPVVALIGLSVALAEESGLKDRITASLDPLLRYIGMSGRDLIPILTGFGCNVVAVFQSRACSSCTRRACVSLISFGSACSYQIGASLALFSTAGYPWLFVPYLLALMGVGVIHNRIWYQALPHAESISFSERAFLQVPTWRAVSWRFRSVVNQFLFQAMPVFLLTCLIAALLQFLGWIEILSQKISPLLSFFHLPGEAAPGILFSILRKDGLLVLNQDQGLFLQSLSSGQVFILVYLASTLTGCLVTLWTIKNELGFREALQMAGKQMMTSLFTAFIFSLFIE